MVFVLKLNVSATSEVLIKERTLSMYQNHYILPISLQKNSVAGLNASSIRRFHCRTLLIMVYGNSISI